MHPFHQTVVRVQYITSVRKLEAIEIKRLHIKKGTLDIPQTREAIKANHTCECEIRNVRKCIEEKADGTRVYKNYSWEELCEIINKFSNYSSDTEWTMLSNIGKKINDNIYFPLEDFYEDIEKKTESPTTAYLRLGAGKGFYFNSVALALYDADTTNDKQKFLQFLKANGYGKVYKPQTRRVEPYDLKPDEFPITRFVEITDTKPLGWVKIEKNR